MLVDGPARCEKSGLLKALAEGASNRPVARDEATAKDLKKRTLTNLYNARPHWLADAHADLDAVGAAVYGWPADICDDDALWKLCALKLTGECR